MTASYVDLRGRNHLHVLGEENARFIDAALGSGWSTQVAACPGWSIADLVFHVCRVQSMFSGMLTTRVETPKELPKLERPGVDAELGGLFRHEASRLVDILTNLRDEDTVWTFIGPRPAAWVKRRMAQEILVHRFDAEIAGGAVTSSEETICADGIDEKLTEFLPRFGDRVKPGGTLHVHCTDTDGEWMLIPNDDGVVVTREHGKGDVAFRGPAQILLLALWERISIDEAIATGAEVFGNRGVLENFATSFRV